ncbi:UNVERIFIED_CONTAM: hypothetical protein K2H54_006263 [Gekko kuhli]
MSKEVYRDLETHSLVRGGGVDHRCAKDSLEKKGAGREEEKEEGLATECVAAEPELVVALERQDLNPGAASSVFW